MGVHNNFPKWKSKPVKKKIKMEEKMSISKNDQLKNILGELESIFSKIENKGGGEHTKNILVAVGMTIKSGELETYIDDNMYNTLYSSLTNLNSVVLSGNTNLIGLNLQKIVAALEKLPSIRKMLGLC